jgi:putative tricarboxylic transport membrane protein
MDVLNSLGQGFAVALTPQNLLFALIGVTLGTAIGVLPGIGPALTISLLLPVTAKLDPTARRRLSWSTHRARRPPW